MIVAITSKGGNAGCTTITVISALTLTRLHGKRVCIIDLKNKQSFAKMLKLDSGKRLDYLITDLSFGDQGFGLKDNIQHFGSSDPRKCVDVILGSIVPYENHLLKCVNNLKLLLKQLNTMYDFVILDVPDNNLLPSLKTIDEPFFTVNVLNQNMLLVKDYQELARSGKLKDLVVANAIEDNIFPQKSLFISTFGKNTCFLPRVRQVRHIMNSAIRDDGSLDFKEIRKLPSYFSEIDRICKILIAASAQRGSLQHSSSEIDEFFKNSGPTKQRQKPKEQGLKQKCGFFQFLVGKGRK